MLARTFARNNFEAVALSTAEGAELIVAALDALKVEDLEEEEE